MERARSFPEKDKKGLILKTLERCKSLGHKRNTSGAHVTKAGSSARAAPGGCITFYVGPGKERFAIRTECVNHPLFKELLDESENLYGYACEGPIELPCDVDRFDRVLWEIDEQVDKVVRSPRCSFPASPFRGFTKVNAGYQVLNPSRLVAAGRF